MIKLAATIKTGLRFSRYETLTSEKIAEFAQLVGDTNLLHRDKKFAAGNNYPNIIASGPQTSALLMAFTADYFSKMGLMLGLEFYFTFMKAVVCDEEIKLEWMIVKVTPHSKLDGDLIDLRGRILNSHGITAVGAKGLVLLKS